VKATLTDYLLSGLAICLIMAASILGVMVVLPWSKALFSDYHVLADFFLALLLYGLLSAALVRVLLRVRPILPGSYDMDSPVFTRWKLVTIVYRLGQSALRPLTPVFLKPVIEALFGARIGRDVALGGTIDDPYMVSVGDGAVLGNASLVSGNFIAGGRLTCGFVKIGSGVTVGANSVVFPDTEIGDGATLIGGSYVMPGARIPTGETWRGNPARKWVQAAGARTPD
jgi:serine acetyltransferase